MADPCPRCGLPFEPYGPPGSCEGALPDEPGVIACRDREIALLKAQLRRAQVGLVRVRRQLDETLAEAFAIDGGTEVPGG